MIRTLEQIIKPTKELLIEKYPSKEQYADEIVNVILAREILKLRINLSTKSWLQLYQEYALPLDTLDSDDVTKTETLMLIYESSLGERDEKIATMFYIERRSEDEIANELQIDKKTVRANIPKISIQLKRTAMQIYRNPKNTD